MSKLDPRMVIKRGAKCREEFIDYWSENLPDLSDRPDISPEQTRFWMMEDPSSSTRTKMKKRSPAAHHKLSGLRAQAVNKAIDFSIASNKWCVTFKDRDNITVDLVEGCILCVWLHYISEMVRLWLVPCVHLRHFCDHTYVIVIKYVYVML